MSPLPTNPSRQTQRIAERCRALGLFVWRTGPQGQLEASPDEPANLGRWLASPQVVALVTHAASSLGDQSPAQIITPSDGLWLLAVPSHDGRRLQGWTIAMGAAPGYFDSADFKALCSKCDSGESAVAGQWMSVGTFGAAEAARLQRCLSWLHEDLQRLDEETRKTEAFGGQLAESYEEISLLYRLGRSLNEVAHPQKFVDLACTELQATLPYRWVAACFVKDRDAARAMAGTTSFAGKLPMDPALFSARAIEVIAALDNDTPRILSGAACTALDPSTPQIPVHPVIHDEMIVGVIMAGGKHGADTQVGSADTKLLDAAAGYLGILLDNAFLYDDQQIMFVGTLEALTASIDAKDPYTCGHSQRVAELAEALARAHGLEPAHAERIRLAGVVHDVGKIGVPEAVLCKTGRLTSEEFEQIKQHPEIGYQILKDIPQFSDLLPGVLYHHERYDGNGYPRRLRGLDIPLMARIIGLVDSFDAMSSNRTYRSAMPRSRVFEELIEHAGTQFDPDLVRSFQKVDLATYDELVLQHQTEAAGGLRIRRRSLAA